MIGIKNKHIESIPFIQFICSVLIVVLHSNNIKGYGFISNLSSLNNAVNVFEESLTMVGHSALPVFFYLSGFLMFRGFRNNLSLYRRKVVSRLRTLVVPYIIWNFLTVMFYWVLSRIPFIAGKLNHMFVPNDLKFIILSIVDSDFTPLWYVRNIFLLSLLSIGLYQIIRFKNICIITISVSIILNLYFKFDYYWIFYWLPMYMAGAATAYYKGQIVRLDNKTVKNSVRLIYMSLGILNIIYKSDALIYIFRMVSVVAVIDLLGDLYKTKWSIKFKEVYKYSFFIYCTHFVVISMYQKIFLICFGNGWFSTLVSYITTPVLCLSIIIPVAIFLNYKWHSLWLVLTGGR